MGVRSLINQIQSRDRFTSPPTQYRLYRRLFLQVKRPNQQYQSILKEYLVQTNQTYSKRTKTQKTASPLVHTNMGWLGDGHLIPHMPFLEPSLHLKRCQRYTMVNVSGWHDISATSKQTSKLYTLVVLSVIDFSYRLSIVTLALGRTI